MNDISSISLSLKFMLLRKKQIFDQTFSFNCYRISRNNQLCLSSMNRVLVCPLIGVFRHEFKLERIFFRNQQEQTSISLILTKSGIPPSRCLFQGFKFCPDQYIPGGIYWSRCELTRTTPFWQFVVCLLVTKW